MHSTCVQHGARHALFRWPAGLLAPTRMLCGAPALCCLFCAHPPPHPPPTPPPGTGVPPKLYAGPKNTSWSPSVGCPAGGAYGSADYYSMTAVRIR